MGITKYAYRYLNHVRNKFDPPPVPHYHPTLANLLKKTLDVTQAICPAVEESEESDSDASYKRSSGTEPLETFDDTASRPKPKNLGSGIYAVIIGINTYPKVTNLKGAVADANAMAEFLTQDLGVPKSQIHSLYDNEATRQAIIDAMDSLVTDTRIQQGDPILIYFAGHGNSMPANPDWKRLHGSEFIQSIIPWDCNTATDLESGILVHPIPDKTIRALINRIAKTKGDNITVIFDSCHSASGNRGDPEIRSTGFPRDAEILIPLPHDIDNNLIGLNLCPLLPGNSRGFLGPSCEDQNSHVFLSACGSNERAWETNGRGAFTSALIKAMKEVRLEDTTYSNLVRYMPRLESQSPHIYGTNKNRVIFNGHAESVRAAYMSVNLDSTQGWILGGGKASGICEGSEWELFEAPERNAPVLATARATKPKANSTILNITTPAPSLTPLVRLYARQTKAGEGHHLKVHISHDAKRFLQRTLEPKTDEFGYIIEKSVEAADVVVNLNQAQTEFALSFRQMDKMIHNVPLPRYPMSFQMDQLEAQLCKVARWHWLMAYSNKAPPKLAISVEFMKITMADDDTTAPELGPNLIKDSVVQIDVGVDDEYAIKVTSHDESPLHVRLLYFNTSELAFDYLGDCTEAKGQKDPELPSNGAYTVGDDGDGGASIRFGLNDGKTEVDFIKVIWSTQEIDLNCLEGGRKIFCVPRNRDRVRWGTQIIAVMQKPRTLHA